MRPAGFSANAGDTLIAFASARTLPILQGTSLNWAQRALTRANGDRAAQSALFTAVVPTGGVTGEHVWFNIPIYQEFGAPDSVGSTAAQIQIFAFDNSAGIGAVGWTSQYYGASTAALTLKAHHANSLILVGGAIWAGSNIIADSNSVLVGSATNRMAVFARLTTAPGNITVGSNVSSTSWELTGIEILPADATPPTKRVLCLGHSAIESNDSTRPLPQILGELLGSDYAIYGGGVWWAYSDQVLNRWNGKWSTLGPWDYVIFNVGANDVSFHGSLDRASWKATVDGISATGTHLMVQTLTASEYYALDSAQRVSDDSWQRANIPPGADVFDWAAALGTPANAVQYVSPDGVHWTNEGNALIAEEYARMILGTH